MRIAIVDGDGIIINLIEMEDGAEWSPPEGCATLAAGDYEIAGRLQGGVYTPPLVAQPAPPSPPMPTSCTKLGLKRAFDELGQWSAVKAAIASNANTQEEWDLAIEIKRTDTLVQGMIAALSLTTEQVDSLLIRASALV